MCYYSTKRRVRVDSTSTLYSRSLRFEFSVEHRAILIKVCRSFLKSLQPNAGILSQIRPPLFPFISLPIHYSLISSPFGATYSELRTASLNKQLIASCKGIATVFHFSDLVLCCWRPSRGLASIQAVLKRDYKRKKDWMCQTILCRKHLWGYVMH
jgi:hypothetical protein